MRVIVVSFGQSFQYLHDACINSIRRNLPNCDLIDIVTEYPEKPNGVIPRFYENTVKLELWRDNMIDGEDNVFLDADTIVLSDFSEVFDKDFDVCYTNRENAPISRLPFNSGVVFARSKKFMDEWVHVNSKMMYDQNFWIKWHSKYYGYNQASFGWMLENTSYNVAKVPSYIYNSCDVHDWKKNLDNAKILHIKGELRQDLDYSRKYADAVRIWKGYVYV